MCKQVPDTTQVKVDLSRVLDQGGCAFIINPFDTYALEESLRLKEKYGFKVAVIQWSSQYEVTLRKALSLGATR